MKLPNEIWWRILLESVVDKAMPTDSPSSLNESLTDHALVCCAWSAIVHEQRFRREAKALLYARGMLFS